MSPDQSGGVFVAVVGASGAGKDTLMSRAARHPDLRPDVRFVRRVVTRAATVDVEDHDSLGEEAFASALASGAFSLTWSAHGLRYALPRSVRTDLGHGHVVVANVSRRSLGDAVTAFGTIEVVEVMAAPEIILERLSRRGREDDATIKGRLRREAAVSWQTPSMNHLTLDNSGEVSVATELLVHHLNSLGRYPFDRG